VTIEPEIIGGVPKNGIRYENKTATCPGGKVTKEDGKFISHVTLEDKNLTDDVWISG
jgi:hypothetical protein